MDLEIVIFIELFVSLHMSVFVFMPISKIFGKDDKEEITFFLVLFVLRALILITYDIMGKYSIAFFDFFFVFFGAFIIVPILSVIFKKRIQEKGVELFSMKSFTNYDSNLSTMKCSKCGSVLTLEDDYCSNCGEKVVKNNSGNNSDEYYQTLIDEVKKKENR